MLNVQFKEILIVQVQRTVYTTRIYEVTCLNLGSKIRFFFKKAARRILPEGSYCLLSLYFDRGYLTLCSNVAHLYDC